MRFAKLSLERYGRFSGCELSFRPGEPDLHLIYGANEAGKSTTVEAVSDLLFGFPTRTSYNFRFDYQLLRVGAVLEDDGRRLACRRRKAQSQTLVDTDDCPIDDGPLVSMLRGWTRDRYRLGFSLDQARLREGGRAIVDAKDDLGQALFAAGSGLTGIVASLTSLEAEAEAVWGKRASAKRLYTIAERQFKEGQALLRDSELRPKAWSDARALAARLAGELDALQARRLELAGERRRLERLRRIGPDIRQRAALLSQIQDTSSAICLSRPVEAAAEAALTALEAAGRARQSADALLAELDQRAAALQLDDGILRVEAEMEALLLRRGAVGKGAADLPALAAELDEKLGREARLREEIGSDAPVVARVAMGRLRDILGRHTEVAAGIAAIETSVRSARAKASRNSETLAAASVPEHLPALGAAVDAALALGHDIDARCMAAARKAARLDKAAQAAMERLRPWLGTVEALRGLPGMPASEITLAEAALRRAREGAEAERLAVAAADTERSALEAERSVLANSGDAVPATHLAEARAAREALWAPLRAHLVTGQTLADPAEAAFTYQVAASGADAVADRRFTRAEASGRLAGLDARAQTLAETRSAAFERMQHWEAEGHAAQSAWTAQLEAAGLPLLPPSGMRDWLDVRRKGLDDLDAAEAAGADMEIVSAGRLAASDRLRDVLARAGATQAGSPEGPGLTPLLDHAIVLRAGWDAARVHADGLAAGLAGLAEQIADATARLAAEDQQRAALVDRWDAQCRLLGLELAIDGAEIRLALLDELRGLAEAVQTLERRVGGIRQDGHGFASDVAALVARVGESLPADAGAAEPGAGLDTMRFRLKQAREADIVRTEIAASRRAREAEIRAADAARDAALAALSPVLDQLGGADIAAIGPALEQSRLARARAEELAQLERRIAEAGDGYVLADLVSAFEAQDPDALARRIDGLDVDLLALDTSITEAAGAAGAARESAEAMETGPAASGAAADAEMARGEMDAQAEIYLAKRAQAVVLRWAVERYRERNQSPMLARASELFRTLTLGKFVKLEVDLDAAAPRLLGLCEDRRRLVAVDHMSEGTTDQLFLALRLAAVEQAVSAGIRLPFIADDLFVNFDDDRARAGLNALSSLARSTQVLVFTHHTHIAKLAHEVVGAELLSECALGDEPY